MKKNLMTFLFVFLAFALSFSQTYKPYTIGTKTSGSLTEIKKNVKSQLENNGFKTLGEYQPADDNNRWLIAFTSNEILNAVKKVGGYTGFASALRVAITKEGSMFIVSYTTPEYWGNAYFGKNYSKVSSLYSTVSSKLKSAFGNGNEQFGAKDGMSAKELQSYHYMLGMPYFGDNVKLSSFSSFNAAVSKIDRNLASGVKNVTKVYSVEVPGKNIKLYGIGLSGSTGESTFLPTIDFGSPKNTAFLPYEMLVVDGDVFMLHGRYRIALSFPDLSMGTFMKIVSTPGNIEELLKSTTK